MKLNVYLIQTNRATVLNEPIPSNVMLPGGTIRSVFPLDSSFNRLANKANRPLEGARQVVNIRTPTPCFDKITIPYFQLYKSRPYLSWSHDHFYVVYVINLNLPPNLRGVSAPFSRVSFYASGSRFIERMIKFNPELKSDSIRLFEEMQSFQNNPKH